MKHKKQPSQHPRREMAAREILTHMQRAITEIAPPDVDPAKLIAIGALAGLLMSHAEREGVAIGMRGCADYLRAEAAKWRAQGAPPGHADLAPHAAQIAATVRGYATRLHKNSRDRDLIRDIIAADAHERQRSN